jgi:DNA-binding LytR/AlgR family response regulator
MWLWFGGFHLLPGVVRNAPFGLLVSGLITGFSTLLSMGALHLMRGRPATLRWSAYLAVLAIAAAAGTLAAAFLMYLLGFFEAPRLVLANFLQNIRATLIVTLVLGSAILARHEWKARVDELSVRSRPEGPPRVPSRVGGKVEFVDLGSVAYIYAQDKLTFAVTPAKHHPLDFSIAELEQKAPAGRWLRIHRKTLVNLDAVRELHTDGRGRLFARMADGAELRVARDRAAQVRAALKG